MSYGFRTPQERILATFSPSTLDNVASYSGRSFEEEESKVGKYFNYNLDDRKKEFASKAGIYLSPYSYRSHSHPLCKTIENYFLYVVIPPLISSFNNLHVVSMKESKLKIIHSESNNRGISLNLINRLMDVKDSYRYQSGDDFKVKYPTMLLNPNSKGYDPLLDVRIERGGNFLFHDELHYWTFRGMLDFLEKFEPSHLICTAVFPVEIFEGATQSYFPEVYSFEILSNGNFIFAPDGEFSEGYEQTVNMKWLFRASSFTVKGCVYSVDMIKTIGAHHLFVITKGKRITRNVRVFKNFDILDLSAFVGTRYKIPIADVHFSFFKKIVIYLKSLKKPDTQSAVAKLRQLEGDSISLTEMLFIEDFAKRFQDNGSALLTVDTLWDFVVESLKGYMPIWVRRFTKSFNKDNILKQIGEARPFDVKIDTLNIDSNYDDNEVWRYLKSLMDTTVIELESDKILFRALEKGESSDSRDRRNVVHQLTPSFYAYPYGDNRSFNKIKIKAVDSVGVMRERTPIQLKSGRKGYGSDQFVIDVARSDRAFSEEQLPFFGQRGLFHNLPFFFYPPGEFQMIPQIGWIDDSEAINDMINELLSSEIEIRVGPFSIPHSRVEEPLSSIKIEELPSSATSEIGSSISSSFSPTTIDINSEDLSDFIDTVNAVKISDKWDEFVVKMKATESLSYSDEFTEYIKGIEAKKIKARKAFYFCKDSTFSYGHDKIVYKNLGWPRVVSELNAIAERIAGVTFNSLLVNSYERGGRIPWHADDEDVYDLEKNPVLTINLIGTGLFTVQDKHRDEVSFELSPGDALLMKNGAQKKIKHCVIAKDRRISLTFRQQIRSSGPQIPERIFKEGDLSEMKELCLINSLSREIKVERARLVNLIIKEDKSFQRKIEEDNGLTLDDLSRISNLLNLRVRVLIDGQWSYFGVKDSKFRDVSLKLENRHFSVYQKEVLRTVLGDEGTSKLMKRSDKAFMDTFLNLVDPNRKFVNKFKRVVDFERCATLIGSFLRGTTGIVSSSTFGNGVSSFTGRRRNVDPDLLRDASYLKELVDGDFLVKGACIMGFAGCGKSRPVQFALNTLDSPLKVLLISPRVNLLNDWKTKVNNKNVILKTFESALKENFSKFSLIIIDEFLLVPRGFTDVVAFKSKMDNITCKRDSSNTEILLLGDPLQSAYFSHSDNDLLPLDNELKTLEIDYPKYLLYSFRMPSTLGKMIEIDMLGSEGEEANFKIYNSAAAAFSEKAFDVVLTPGQQEKTFFSNYKVMTFGESQGLTFDKVCISLSEDTLLCSDNHIMVGLTRAKKGISFVKCFDYDISEFLKRAGSRLIGKVLRKQTIKRTELECMTGLEDVEFITKPPTFGGHEEKVQGDPWMKSLLTLVQEESIESEIILEPEIQETKTKVHINITDKAYALTILNDQIRAKELREHRSKDAWSNQFKDNDSNLMLESSSGPVNFESIFPRHTSFDDVTFWMAVKKRLTFSNPLIEGEKLKKAWIKGGILFNEFEKMVRINPRFRPDLFEKGLRDFEEVRMRKSEKLIEAHAGRSDPDWDIRNFLLFMKTQLCKKAEKAYVDAKAGQTIACFSHGVLFKFSAWARYAELKINEVLPESFYIHSKKNFDSLEEWVKKNFIGPVCVESDYEAFDASQDAVILAFEVLVLKKVGWPNDLIEDYKTLKLELGCKLGTLAIMRFTGEFGTFFFNTLANMAFTFCRYNVNRRTPICFAGDDMCILADAKVRHEMDDFISSLKLKAKVQWKENPIFCGWVLSRRGILKLPSLVYYRLMIAIEKGNLKDCIDSYMIEAGYAYRKGSYIEELLDEDQLNFHQLVIRKMVKSKHLMKGSSVDILDDLVGNYSDGV